MKVAPLLVDGVWETSPEAPTFTSLNPLTGETLADYPISDWTTLDRMLEAGVEAFHGLAALGPDTWSRLLDRFADLIEAGAEELAGIADAETALGVAPRLREIEIPRTVDQLRQAAAAASSRSWRHPVISPQARIASFLAPMAGPICVMGPNNFPFAFNSVAGGDAAAALATGHPVIAKANPGHPGTTARLTELAVQAADSAGAPPGTIQLVYRMGHEDGERLVADPRLAATGYTGSRSAGLALKRAADGAGRPIYLEMSSVNPVVLLTDALAQGEGQVSEMIATSMLAGSGQFCTSPGLVFVVDSPDARAFLDSLALLLGGTEPGVLLGNTVRDSLEDVFQLWTESGAEILAQGPEGNGICYPNTLLRISGDLFRHDPKTFQQEAFGNMAIVVVCSDPDELMASLSDLEGNLTGTIFGRGSGTDPGFGDVAGVLRPRVGRLLADKVPTGVAVVDAMNHGGPYPSTGHPGFTAVGIPASLTRFCALQCFDNFPDDLLPKELQSANPLGIQRRVDGAWTNDSFVWG